MPKAKPDMEYFALFLLIFVLVFAFGVVVGSYACSIGDTGDLTVNVVDDNGDAVEGAQVTANGDTKNTGGSGEVTYTNIPFDSDLAVTAEKGTQSNTTTFDFNSDGQTVTIVLGDDEDSSKLVEQA